MRVTADANVIVSALLSPTGVPARLIDHWRSGGLELLLCPQLLSEIEAVLARPRIRSRVSPIDAEAFVAALQTHAEIVPDPTAAPPVRSTDADDDYLIALAARERVPLISGDRHLLDLADRIPVRSPRESLDELET